jgi:hypothetical protein
MYYYFSILMEMKHPNKENWQHQQKSEQDILVGGRVRITGMKNILIKIRLYLFCDLRPPWLIANQGCISSIGGIAFILSINTSTG